MPIFILIDVQYLHIVVFSFKKVSNGDNQSSSNLYHPITLTGKISIPPTLNVTWKTVPLSCTDFHLQNLYGAEEGGLYSKKTFPTRP